MQGGRQGRDSFFDSDPFADFGGFGGFGGHQSLVSSFFGGRSPFDDPFFTHPFPSPCSLFGPSHNPFPSPCSIIRSSRPFPSPCSIFGSSHNPFPGAPSAGPQHNKRRGPVIEEIDSDDENAEDGGASNAEDNPRKYCRLDKEPYVETPDDKADEERNNHIQHRSDYSSRMPPQSQSHCFTFRSSSVSYGGANGAYYTKSMTRRAGSDGVAYEEFKEADSTTGQANHRISRGLHNKGHTLSRKLNSDGRVDSMQTLHNLNEDELPVFEQAWEGSAARHLPGWRPRIAGDNNTEHVNVSFARSGGPGGQNVNKVNTKVDMRFNVKNATWLSERVRDKIMQMEKNRINKDGEIVISSTKTRTQQGNIEDALGKLQVIIDAAAYVPPPPSEDQKKKIAKLAAKSEQKRLQNKKALSQKKSFRRSKDCWD